MPKTYILYKARFLQVFMNKDCQMVPVWVDFQNQAMWYNDNTRDLQESAIRTICAYENITPDQLELITE